MLKSIRSLAFLFLLVLCLPLIACGGEDPPPPVEPTIETIITAEPEVTSEPDEKNKTILEKIENLFPKGAILAFTACLDYPFM